MIAAQDRAQLLLEAVDAMMAELQVAKEALEAVRCDWYGQPDSHGAIAGLCSTVDFYARTIKVIGEVCSIGDRVSP